MMSDNYPEHNINYLKEFFQYKCLYSNVVFHLLQAIMCFFFYCDVPVVVICTKSRQINKSQENKSSNE